ncbi:MAG: adenylate/guanylate cyclase domain-containing protein [Acetobacteraceae bacterium]|nr:adenylate/guanylate cyclase domain-containing protein [Acetobacteraceae bacterium]
MTEPVRPTALICRGCWDQMHVPIPIRGPLALPFRLFGITRSKMSPEICTICERAFQAVQRRRHVTRTATILFADIRGYTALSEVMEPVTLSETVSAFQDQCARAVWAEAGIVNKQMGDGLMAIFNFPIRVEDHAAAALRAGIAIQHRCRIALAELARRLGGEPGEGLGVGVGIHTGSVEIGQFSTTPSDFTAIGGTVNLAARLEGQAAPGEILLSPEAASAAALPPGTPRRSVTLKGLAAPVEARVVAAA